jgi:hypothetical protein
MPKSSVACGDGHRQLPETYRTVFMLRDIEGLSTSETGERQGLGDEGVKTRLHRAPCHDSAGGDDADRSRGHDSVRVPGSAVRSRRGTVLAGIRPC